MWLYGIIHLLHPDCWSLKLCPFFIVINNAKTNSLVCISDYFLEKISSNKMNELQGGCEF